MTSICHRIYRPFTDRFTDSPKTNPRVKRIEKLGTAGQYAVPTTTVLFGLYHRDYEGVFYFLALLLANQVIIEGCKKFIPEIRPNGGKRSFFSGHTAASFLGAASLTRRYEWKHIPSALEQGMFAAATFVGTTRVIARAHWIHDVIIGAFVGYLLSFVLPILQD